MRADTSARVLIADDHREVRDGLVSLIENEEGLEVAAVAADAAEAIELAARAQPDVAVIDLRMPFGGGAEALRGIAACSPGTKLIALSADGSLPADFDVELAGFLLKGGSVGAIIDAVKRAAASASRAEDDLASTR